MTDKSYALFEGFVEDHADNRVIAISHHIEWLIDNILELEKQPQEEQESQ